MFPRILISMERFNNCINYHITVDKSNVVVTIQVRNIFNEHDYQEMIKAILDNDHVKIVNYFKIKHNLYHEHISFAYGPQLRAYIKQIRLESLRIPKEVNK